MQFLLHLADHLLAHFHQFSFAYIRHIQSYFNHKNASPASINNTNNTFSSYLAPLFCYLILRGSALRASPLRNKHIRAELPYSFHVLLHFFGSSSIPSSSCGTNGPSLLSKITELGSIASSVCHTPLGIFTPYRPSSGQSITLSIMLPSSL